uniref:ATP synthase complex subunit 8 n=1 Tax=Coryphaena equiselis TaxID=13454 RepID=T2HT04_9TELE|nr:ATP synthase F0 subunit 8 [Coryphaena equiselis]WNH38471.1 ATP synthase F0 subunit 8 [Coryphaena equiselis]BAN83130.1 ATPase subunit 8 [Coryphaena equiselis]
MPQLNPSPWLMTLVMLWLVFLIFLPPKILPHTLPNKPVIVDNKKSMANPWNWLWH